MQAFYSVSVINIYTVINIYIVVCMIIEIIGFVLTLTILHICNQYLNLEFM